MSKKIIQAGAIAVALFLICFVALQVSPNQTIVANSQVQEGTLIVSGVGELNAEPDMATIHLGAEAVASTADEALEKVDKNIKAIKKVLTDFKIEDKQIQTAYYNVYPYHEPTNNGKAEEKFRADHALKVELHDVDQLGELLNHITKAGANRIDQIRFGLQNPEKAEHEALQLAITKTKEKANAMAASAGKKRGDIIQIADQAAQIDYSFADHMSVETEQSSDSMSIEKGEVKVIQRVDVVYKLN